MRKHEKKCSVYVGFIDLEKANNRVNRKALWQMLRMHAWGKLLSGIKSMYVYSSACIRVKWGESEWFRIDSGVRQGCIMSPQMSVQSTYGWSDDEGENRDGKEGSELSGEWGIVEIAWPLVYK